MEACDVCGGVPVVRHLGKNAFGEDRPWRLCAECEPRPDLVMPRGPGGRRKLPTARRDLILAMLASGMRQIDVAAEIGVDPSTVSKVARVNAALEGRP